MDAGNNIGKEETETVEVLQEIRDHPESQVNRAPTPDQSVDYEATDKDEGEDHAILSFT